MPETKRPRHLVPPNEQYVILLRDEGKCRFPECAKSLIYVLRDGAGKIAELLFFGEFAHIRSPSVGGPRYDPDYPEDKLNTHYNVMAMCPDHHRVIDRHHKHFPVETVAAYCDIYILDRNSRPLPWRYHLSKLHLVRDNAVAY